MPSTASLLFDGVNDSAETGTSPSGLVITGDKTIEFWAKASSYNVDHPAFVGWSSDPGSAGNFPYLVTLNFNGFRFTEMSGFGAQTHSVDISALSTGAWHHFAVTVASRVVQVYIDGAAFGSTTTLTGSTPSTTSALQIGHSAYDNYVSARMDEIRIWSVARTSGEVAAYYDKQAIGSETGLVAYWRANEGSGTTVADLAGTATDLTLSGATWDTSDFPTLTDAGGATTAYRDATTRTRLAVRAFRDAALRLRLSAGAYRDGAVRLRLQAGSYRDAAARFRLLVGAYKDATTRVRLSAGAYKDAGVRFLLQLGEQIARPTADVSNDNWTTDTGATTNLYASIDEVSANDSDYIQSSPSPADWEEYQTRLGDLVDPGLTTGHAIRVRFQKSATGGDRIDLRIRLYRADGVTVITETGYADIDALQTFEFALSEPNADAIPYADYPDLVLGIASRENNGAGGSAGPWL